MLNSKPVRLTAIIDDDEIHTFVIKTFMNQHQFSEQIIAFSNGQQALEFLSDHRQLPQQLPDVIFVDIAMPVMNAWQFLENFTKIKGKLSKQIAVYVLTTSIYESDADKALSYPEVSGFLVKPLKKEYLDHVALQLQSFKQGNILL